MSAPIGTVEVVLGTGAFELLLGSTEVMANQRSALEQLNQRPGIDILVLPRLSAGHPGLSARFSLLDFAGTQQPSVVYLKALTGARYLEGKRHVTAYRDAFATLRRISVPIEEFQ